MSNSGLRLRRAQNSREKTGKTMEHTHGASFVHQVVGLELRRHLAAACSRTLERGTETSLSLADMPQPIPRNTRQKQAIRHAFVEADRPLSPEEALNSQASITTKRWVSRRYTAISNRCWRRAGSNPSRCRARPPATRWQVRRTITIFHCPQMRSDV